jgi:hypothetical protein
MTSHVIVEAGQTGGGSDVVDGLVGVPPQDAVGGDALS